MPAERIDGVAWRQVVDITGGMATRRQDRLAEEVPLAIHVDGEPLAVMMVSPCDLEDFARGFALTELGIAGDDVASMEVRTLLEGVQLDLSTRHPLPTNAPDRQRGLPGRSGCGICGQRNLEDVLRQPARVGQGAVLGAPVLDAALAALASHQPLNRITGAVHAAAWVTLDGVPTLVREDVGRHNALDKLIGALVRPEFDPDTGFALITSRASYEMVAKAAAAGIPLLAALSAPTALAVDLANACGMTLVGFVRDGRHVVYSHAHRLQAASR